MREKDKKKGGGGLLFVFVFFFLFGINWSYFTMSLLYWGLKFLWEKKFGPYLKKIRP